MEKTVKNRTSIKNNLAYILSRAKGILIETDLNPYYKRLACIKEYNLSFTPDPELINMGKILRQRARESEPLDRLLPAAYALVSEVCKRKLGLTPYDVQLIAGIVLHNHKLAQMQTGEGKTLAAVFPAVLNSLTGKGVHILTANDYLAKRDAEWMKPVYQFLGLEVSYIEGKMALTDRKTSYRADITYLTAKEAGFDLLRDQLCYKPEDLVQRDFHYVIIDEADFILIDEARIPLVIAAPAHFAAPAQDIVASVPEPDHKRITQLIPYLICGIDYGIDRRQHNVHLTLAGQQKVQNMLNCEGIHEEHAVPVYAAVHVALIAHHLLVKDIHYLVRKDKIELVDEFTGRVADKRRWPYGIQNALEAKEGLPIQPEGQIYGSITIQHFINLYPHKAALTATAVSGASELVKFYGLGTVIIPSHKPVKREDKPDRLFTAKHSKLVAIINEIKRVHATGQPILVGTSSIKESQHLAEAIAMHGVSCQVLNAKNDEREAELVARAGMLGAVTIATNMAGRGTDIKLGGEAGIEQEKIKQLGGLYILGTNRHDSVRIDDQLRGRAGRQGDPGVSCFFISLEDPLIERYAIREFIPQAYLPANTQPQGSHTQSITDPRVVKEVARAQVIIEDQNYKFRQVLRKYSALVEKQRQYIQQLRMQALKEKLIPEELWETCQDHFEQLAINHSREIIKEILIHIFLYTIDRFWADHLLFIDELKEGIHLQALGGQDPLTHFQKQASNKFITGIETIVPQAGEQFNRLHLTAEDLDAYLKKHTGYGNPGSTWTYLIDEDPLPAFTLTLMAGHRTAGNHSARFLATSIAFSIIATLVTSCIYFILKFF